MAAVLKAAYLLFLRTPNEPDIKAPQRRRAQSVFHFGAVIAWLIEGSEASPRLRI